MKKPIVTTIGILAASAALAGAHFLSASAALQGANLHMDFREAGLGDNQSIDYIGRAHSVALYACINGGGTNPSASNKRSVEGDLAVPGHFVSGKNGSLVGSLNMLPPDDATFQCPPGQARKMVSIQYSNASVTDQTNDVTEFVPGTFSFTFINLKN